ncbi:hypothetical protein ACROYT_G004025 [Oculina patagonica]
MAKTSTGQPLTTLCLTQLILVWWFVASGLCCLEDVHPGNCSCHSFGRTRLMVKCQRIKQVPRDLPSNTAILNLSGNNLISIEEDVFRNLTLLGYIDLSRNSLKSIPHNTFQNLTRLKKMQVHGNHCSPSCSVLGYPFNLRPGVACFARLVIYRPPPAVSGTASAPLPLNLDENDIKGGFYLPKSAAIVKMKANMLSLDDLKVIAGQSREIIILDIAENPIGPTLTSDTFPGFDKIVSLNMSSCGLKHIESGIFRRMKKLTNIDLGFNMLTHIEAGTFEGLSDNLMTLSLKNNALTTIADGTFSRFSKLSILKLRNNILKSLPDLTGPTDVKTL